MPVNHFASLGKKVKNDAKRNSERTVTGYSRRHNNGGAGAFDSERFKPVLTPKHFVEGNKMVGTVGNKSRKVQITPRFVSHKTQNIVHKPFSVESIKLNIQRRSQFIGECCELKKDGKVLVRSCRLVD